MRKLTHMLLAGTLVLACSSCGVETTANYQVIPLPQEVALSQESPFNLNAGTIIAYPENNELLKRNAEFLAEYISQSTGHTLQTEASQEIYRIRYGLSNPSSALTCATASSVIIGTWRMRSATSAGSDGIRLINTKHTNEMIIRSGIADRIRFMIYCFIYFSFISSLQNRNQRTEPHTESA